MNRCVTAFQAKWYYELNVALIKGAVDGRGYTRLDVFIALSGAFNFSDASFRDSLPSPNREIDAGG